MANSPNEKVADFVTKILKSFNPSKSSRKFTIGLKIIIVGLVLVVFINSYLSMCNLMNSESR